jgi:hypothetical protein
MVFGGLGGAGSTPSPVSAALAASEVLRARSGARVPDEVIAAAREARSMHRRKRRIRRWTRLRIVK